MSAPHTTKSNHTISHGPPASINATNASHAPTNTTKPSGINTDGGSSCGLAGNVKTATAAKHQNTPTIANTGPHQIGLAMVSHASAAYAATYATFADALFRPARFPHSKTPIAVSTRNTTANGIKGRRNKAARTTGA